MEANPASRVLVDWLETEIAQAIGDRKRIALAYSGGLGSTLVAAIARKRCDLTCYAVGIGGAADLEAADLAHAYLDYRIEKIRLTPSKALALARHIAAREPDAALVDVFTMVPIWAVRERVTHGTLLTGFGVESLSKRMRNLLEPLETTNPLLSLGGERGPGARERWSACADVLCLPPKFGRPRRRPPGSGSGIERATRALAAERRTTIRALVRPPDYHVRPKHRSRPLD